MITFARPVKNNSNEHSENSPSFDFIIARPNIDPNIDPNTIPNKLELMSFDVTVTPDKGGIKKKMDNAKELI